MSQTKSHQVEHVDLSSTAIKSLDYDAKQFRLTITFTSGMTQSVTCDAATFKAFSTAESPGTFYNRNIRGKSL